MWQKLTLIGHLGKNPELRYTPSGQAVCNFSMATSRKWAGQDGQLQEETVWFKVSTWGKQAETCNRYLSKGQKVLVEGRLTVDKDSGGPRVWQDQNGNWRASYEVTALEVRFLSSRSDSNGGGGEYQEERVATAPESVVDEIPF